MKFLIVLPLVLLGALPALAQPVFTVNPVTPVNPGSSFQLTFSVTSPEAFEGFDIYLSSTAADDNLFTVTADSPDSPFEFIAGPPTLPDNLTSAVSEDFGATETTTKSNLSAGTYTLETLTLDANAELAPGLHTLTLSNFSGVYNSSSNDYTSAAPLAINVVVAPEPPISWLLLLSLAGLLPVAVCRGLPLFRAS